MSSNEKDPIKEQKRVGRKLTSGGNNPITGLPANSYTKAYRTEADGSASVISSGTTSDGRMVLPEPKQKDKKAPSPQRASRQKRAREMKNNTVDSRMDAPLGYRFGSPEHLESMTDQQAQLVGWLAGVHHVFKGPRSGPAINEPHEAGDDFHLPRRLEDLSGNEYEHAESTLRDFGHSDPAGPIESLRKTQMRHTVKALGEHAAAGTEESASQLFYGGDPTTQISNERLAKTHQQMMSETQARFSESVARVSNSTQFQNAMKKMDPSRIDSYARSVAANSTTRTSPNTKWREGEKWPNMAAGDEATAAALEGRAPVSKVYAPSRPENVKRAVVETKNMVNDLTPRSALDKYKKDDARRAAPYVAPKTRDFGNALIDPNNADSRAVADIMEGHQISPWLHTKKSAVYELLDSAGQRAQEPHPNTGNMKDVAKVEVHPGMRVPKGFTPSMEVSEVSGKAKQEKGRSEVEAMLAEGDSFVHAANDYATRKVNSALGISRGVNYADGVNEVQALRWGSEQQERSDIKHVSSATQYPVIRDWASEGVTMSGPRPAHAAGSQFDWMYEQKSMEPQWAENPNTKGTAGNPLRTKPYLKMPGE